MHSPLDEKLGVEYLEVSKDLVRAKYPVAGNTQPFGLWHGGASGVVAETLASLAALQEVGPSGKVAGLNLAVQHLASTKDGEIIGTAKPVKIGKSIGVYAVTLTQESVAETTLIATAQVTVRFWR